jgi:hypothetical protein
MSTVKAYVEKIVCIFLIITVLLSPLASVTEASALDDDSENTTQEDISARLTIGDTTLPSRHGNVPILDEEIAKQA